MEVSFHATKISILHGSMMEASTRRGKLHRAKSSIVLHCMCKAPTGLACVRVCRSYHVHKDVDSELTNYARARARTSAFKEIKEVFGDVCGGYL